MFLDVHLGMVMSDPDNTSPHVLSWVSVCFQVAGDLNLHSPVRVCERLNDVVLNA